MNNDDNQQDNNEQRPEDRYFQEDGQMRFHWGADGQIMNIIRVRDNSPETQALVERRITLARPGLMRPQWNRELKREIYVPRRPQNAERREIKRIDVMIKQKEENRNVRLGGGYFEYNQLENRDGPQQQQQQNQPPQQAGASGNNNNITTPNRSREQ